MYIRIYVYINAYVLYSKRCILICIFKSYCVYIYIYVFSNICLYPEFIWYMYIYIRYRIPRGISRKRGFKKLDPAICWIRSTTRSQFMANKMCLYDRYQMEWQGGGSINNQKLRGGFKYVLFSSLLGKMIQFQLFFFRWVETTNLKIDWFSLGFCLTPVSGVVSPYL